MKCWVQGLLVGAALTLLVLGVVACTEQTSARGWGGTASLDLESGRKVVSASWKDSDSLWILTRPMRDGETAETYLYSESSAYGIVQGTVLLKEHSK
jgi:hypothetical protein